MHDGGHDSEARAKLHIFLLSPSLLAVCVPDAALHEHVSQARVIRVSDARPAPVDDVRPRVLIVALTLPLMSCID